MVRYAAAHALAATPPSRPALRERYEARRREVVDAAAREFARRGFDQTTMQDLVKATGLAAGGLYHYIGSKERLLVSVCDALMEPLLEQARDIVGREDLDAEGRLRALVRAWVEHVGHHRDHMVVFTQARHVVERDPAWREVRRSRDAFERLLDEVLRQGEEQGAFAFADRRLALLALLGMVNHAPQWFRPRGRLSAAEVADGFVDLLLGRRP